ncbi:MAG TPA: IMP dehydrogenase, partial [Candidatus Fermentibacter sp.]|nr:IMP dehydrogenase [Candidatus Fermentibacter sp.]
MPSNGGADWPEKFTFDDVLLLPGYSEVIPSEVDLGTVLARDIALRIPIVSAAMDTVTESEMAIALAQEGGMGVIHKNLSIESQCGHVRRVKRSESGIVVDPVTISVDALLRDAVALASRNGISGFPVVDGDRLVGMLTNRDYQFEEDMDRPVRELMTPADRLITAPH